jgi:CheY-like chemotaxis protein
MKSADGGKLGADVLVVDDEADIRDLVAGILEDEGYCRAHGGRLRSRPWRPSARAGRRC